MKASDLIARLEELKAEYGDVDVLIADKKFSDELDYEPEDASVSTVLFNEDSRTIDIEYYGMESFDS